MDATDALAGAPDDQRLERLRDSGIAALALLTQLHGRPHSAASLRHLAGDPDRLAGDALVRLARQLRFKARHMATAPARLPRLPLPAVAELRDGSFLVVLKACATALLLHEPVAQQTFEMPLADFVQLWSGHVILFATRPHISGGQKFGLSWFVPAIVKYRQQLTEVLTASLFLQLLGLISPLFTQVVVDKVLVHKSLTTLDVLVLGTVVVALFEALLGGLRTYIFSHTTNRVDVELGARLFGHLLNLPLPYFLARKAGDSVARVRELENMRNFLTGNALTAAMDLLFTIVFLGVMLLYSVPLTCVVLGTLPAYAILSLVVTPVLRARLDHKYRCGAENQAFLVEALGGIETIKSMALEPVLQRKWEAQLAAYVAAAFRTATLSNGANQVASSISKLCAALLLWIGAGMAIRGTLSIGELIAFSMLAGRVAAPVLRLAQLWQDWQQLQLSVARLGDILDNPAETGRGGLCTMPPLAGEIRLEQVHFRYGPDGADVLRSFSLLLAAGGWPRAWRGGAVRLRQEHARQAGAAPVPSHPGAYPDRWPGSGRDGAGVAAAPDRRRTAGQCAVLGQCAR